MPTVFRCWTLCIAFFAAWVAVAQEKTVRVYDPDPSHPWNRVYAAFYLRSLNQPFDLEESLDPLLWDRYPGAFFNYLRTEPTRSSAALLLDEFVANHYDKLIGDPLKRALFQRDLWAVLDWYDRFDYDPSAPQVADVHEEILTIMKRIALSTAEIASLPDNANQAACDSPAMETGFDAQWHVLDKTSIALWALAIREGKTVKRPPHALVTRSMPCLNVKPREPLDEGWLLIGDGAIDRPAAVEHTAVFQGRSVFLSYIRVPGGRDRGLAYLAEANASSKSQDRHDIRDPLDLPPPPNGATLALVRRMMLIDDTGTMRMSPITEELQTIAHIDVPSLKFNPDGPDFPARAIVVNEFRLNREMLFRGEAGGLRAVDQDELAYGPVFGFPRMHGKDAFNKLNSCGICHGSTASPLTLNSLHQDGQNVVTATAVESSVEKQMLLTIALTERSDSWKAIKRFWQSAE